METKKIMATFTILMLALGVAGYAYAHWCDTLYLEGTITTGTVDVEWSWDGELINGNKTLETGEEYVVATMTGVITDNTLTITITNVFPCLKGWFEIDVHNAGSIPVKFCDGGCMISGTDLTPWIEYEESWSGDGTCEQIDPCQNVTLRVDFHFVQENDAGATMPQGATMTISCELLFCNWNEPCPQVS